MPGKFAEPLIGEETPNGSNFDDEGEQIDGSDFRSIYAICTELGISNDIVERIIYGKPKKEIKKAGEELPEVNPNVRHKVGRSRTRSETELFSLADIRRIYEEGIQGEDGELLPETNEENILLVDGKPYCTVKQIHRNTGLPESRINNIVSGHSLVPIRARAGNTKQPSDLYPIQEILDIARESVLGFPIFPERQENYEIDGENWANIKSLASSLAVSESTLTGLLKTKTEDGWIINDGIKNNKAIVEGHGEILFSISQVSDLTKDRREAPAVDLETGVFIDQKTGKAYASQAYFEDSNYQLGQTAVSNILNTLIQKNGVAIISGLDKTRQIANLYSIADVDKYMAESGRIGLPTITQDKTYTIDGKEYLTLVYFSEIHGLDCNNFLRAIVSKYKDQFEIKTGILKGSNNIVNIYRAEDLLAIPEISGKLGIYSGSELPIVDSSTGIYIDKNGARWSTLGRIEKVLNSGSVRELLLTFRLPFIYGISTNIKRPLYNLDRAILAYEALVTLPHVDQKTGIYTDSYGKAWTTIKRMITVLGNKGHVGKIVPTLNSIDGVDTENQKRKLYSLDQAREIIQKIEAMPHVDIKTGIYTDLDGKRWATLERIKEIISPGSSTNIVDMWGISLVRGLDSVNIERDLYSLDEAEAQFATKFGHQPMVNNETGLYVDPAGVRWAALKRLAKVISPHRNIIRKVKTFKLDKILGIDSSNRPNVELYNVDQAEKLLIDENLQDLPQVDLEGGIYVDDKGRRWAPKKVISQYLTGKDNASFLANYQIDSIPGKDRRGFVRDLYDLDRAEIIFNELPRVDQETGIYTDTEGRRWAPYIVITQYIAGSRSAQILKNLRLKSIEGKNRNGAILKLYSLDQAEQEYRKVPRVNPEGIYIDSNGKRWATKPHLLKIFSIGEPKFDQWENQIDSIPGLVQNTRRTERLLYSLDQAEEIFGGARVDPKTGIYTDSKGRRWATLRIIFLTLRISNDTFAPQKSRINWIKGADRSGKERILYCLDQAEEIFGGARVDPKTGIYTDSEGKRWATITSILKFIGISAENQYFLEKKADFSFLEGKDGSNHDAILYSLDQAEEIFGGARVDPKTGIYTDSEGKRWATMSTLMKMLEVGYLEFGRQEDKLLSIKGRDARGGRRKLYNIEQAEEIFDSSRNLVDKSKEVLAVLLSSPESKKLFFLLGMVNHSDVLHLLSDKDFEEIPEKEKLSILRDYLGDTMLQRMSLRSLGDPEVLNVFKRIDDLDEKTRDKMAFNLVETVIKNGIIDLYSEMTSGSHSEADFTALVEDWFQRLKQEAQSSFLNSVLDQSLAELDYITNYQKPDQIVDRLGEGRDFPDFYQKVNIAGIRKKKKLLIADEMGMGKSASAILAKESLVQAGKVRSALLVVPSNIIESGTWQNYLGAHSDENKKGYFVGGKEPKVLVSPFGSKPLDFSRSF